MGVTFAVWSDVGQYLCLFAHHLWSSDIRVGEADSFGSVCFALFAFAWYGGFFFVAGTSKKSMSI